MAAQLLGNMSTSLCPFTSRRRRREASIVGLVITIFLLRQHQLASWDLASEGTGKTHRNRVRMEKPSYESQNDSGMPRPQAGYVTSLENMRYQDLN